MLLVGKEQELVWWFEGTQKMLTIDPGDEDQSASDGEPPLIAWTTWEYEGDYSPVSTDLQTTYWREAISIEFGFEYMGR